MSTLIRKTGFLTYVKIPSHMGRTGKDWSRTLDIWETGYGPNHGFNFSEYTTGIISEMDFSGQSFPSCEMVIIHSDLFEHGVTLQTVKAESKRLGFFEDYSLSFALSLVLGINVAFLKEHGLQQIIFLHEEVQHDSISVNLGLNGHFGKRRLEFYYNRGAIIPPKTGFVFLA